MDVAGTWARLALEGEQASFCVVGGFGHCLQSRLRGVGAHSGGQGAVTAFGDGLEGGGHLLRRLVFAVDHLGGAGAASPIVVDGAVAEVFEVRIANGCDCCGAIEVAGGKAVEDVFHRAHRRSA